MEESAERFWPSSAKVEVASQIRAAPIVSGPWDWRREATTTSAKELLRLKPSAAAAAPCLRANLRAGQLRGLRYIRRPACSIGSQSGIHRCCYYGRATRFCFD